MIIHSTCKNMLLIVLVRLRWLCRKGSLVLLIRKDFLGYRLSKKWNLTKILKKKQTSFLKPLCSRLKVKLIAMVCLRSIWEKNHMGWMSCDNIPVRSKGSMFFLLIFLAEGSMSPCLCVPSK